MGITHLSGLEVGGVPTLGTNGLPLTTIGTYYFVNSTNGSNGNTGLSADQPLATVAYALDNLVTANRGDTIVVGQGHAEDIAAAGGWTCDTAGVNIIGLGSGSDRPELTFKTATTASVLVSAANVTIANIVGIAGIDLLSQPFDVRAAGCTLGNVANGPIEWQDAGATQAIRQVLTTSAADNLRINLKVAGSITGGTAPVNSVRLVGVDGAIINLDFYGRASTAVVEFVTTACTNVEVYGYVYNSGTTTGTKNVVDTQGSSTWFASLNDGAAGQVQNGGSAAGLSFGGSTLAEQVATGGTAVMVNGNTLFTITGGAIMVRGLFSLCISANDGTASTIQYQAVPTTGTATTISNASASIASAAAGATITLAGTALATAALYAANGPNLIANPGTVLVPAGAIKIVVGTGSTTGTWKHFLRYAPMVPGVTVVGT